MPYTSMVKLLLESEACVNAQTDLGETAMHQAAKKGHEEVAKLLYANGADIDARSFKGETALHLAVNHGHIELVVGIRRVGAGHGFKQSRRLL